SAGHHGDTLDLLGPVREHQRVLAQARSDLAHEGLCRQWFGESAAEADSTECFLDLDAELTCEQGVVSDLRVGVEGQVVGGEREVGVEQRLQAALHPSV